MRDRLAVSILLDGLHVSSETLTVTAGAHVLVLSTTIAAPHVPYSLHSTYIGQRGEPTAVTHLLLAPAAGAELVQRRHAAHELPVADDERHTCLYDHLQELQAALGRDGHEARIDIGDHSIAWVNR